MTDQAFALHTIRTRVRKIDFRVDPRLRAPGVLDAEIAKALTFLEDPSPHFAGIEYGRIGGKPVALARTYSAKLAVRKIDENLRASNTGFGDDRRAVVLSLKSVLSDAVRYNLYKLDVRQFYESFDHQFVMTHLRKTETLSNGTRRIVDFLLRQHASKGFSGIPRGLSLSSTLSELMMARLDSYIEGHPEVFFYRRYVDDLTIVTSRREDTKTFLTDVSSKLSEISPRMVFKTNKRYDLSVEGFKAPTSKSSSAPKFKSFDYLGYAYNVATENHKKICPPGRDVWLDVASRKVAKIKTRMVRSFLDYLKNKNFELLDNRIRHLTSNMSLLDRSRGVKRMIGIHFNYPLVNYDRTVALRELDRFLKNAIRSSKGRVSSKLFLALTPAQKKALSRHSFFTGAKSKHFFHMKNKALLAVQRCWKYG